MRKVYARYDGPRVRHYITPGKLYEADEWGIMFIAVDDAGDRIHCLWDECPHLDGGNWTRVEIPDESTPRKWFTVPDYRPSGDPATSATVVDRAGQQVAHFESIADAEAAVAAVNGRKHDTA